MLTWKIQIKSCNNFFERAKKKLPCCRVFTCINNRLSNFDHGFWPDARHEMAVLGLMNSWLAQETVDALIIYTDKRWSHVEETEFGSGPCDRFVWCSILEFCRPNLGHQDFDGSFAAKAGDGTQAT